MMWRLLLCSLFVFAVALSPRADTLVMAGNRCKLAAPFILEGREVLAPLLPALSHLGIKAFTRGTAISLVQPDGTTCKLQLNSKIAAIGRRTIPLPVAPRKVDTTWYLPVKALAPLLNAEARYDAKRRALLMFPLLTVSYERRRHGTAILLNSTIPLQYSRRTLSAPPRTYLDVSGVSLGMEEQHIPVNQGSVQRIRLHQHSLNPAVLRLVLDLDQSVPVTETREEKGRRIVLLVGTKAASTASTTLLSLSRTPGTGAVTEIRATTDTGVKVESKYERRARTLTVLFHHCSGTLTPRQLRALQDDRVTKVALYRLREQAGSKLVLTLKRDLEYVITHDTNQVRIRIGRFNLRGKLIVLDAGHGGNGNEFVGAGPGAVGNNGTEEEFVNLDVVLRAAKLLQPTGATVVLTRKTDVAVRLGDRVALANARRADLFLAVHCNSSIDPESAGTETYYYTPQSQRFAEHVHAALLAGLALRDRKVHHNRNFEVITYTRMPSVLIELAFINNLHEEGLLASPAFRQKAAEAIVNGIRDYVAGSVL